MGKLRELIDALSDEAVKARTFQSRRMHICKICQSPANTFKAECFELEYRLSTICESCQRYFAIHTE